MSAAVDRLRNFHGDQLLVRSGTLASIKSLGSIASAAPSGVSGASGPGEEEKAVKPRPGDVDAVIDPYNLTESELSSSSDEGEAGETEWESASRGDGGDADEDDDEPLSDGEAERDVEGRDGAVVRLMLEREYGKAPAGTGSRSVAGARSAAARSNAAPRSNAGGRSVAGARIVAGARSVVGGRSFAARSVATVATEADGSPASGAGRGPTAQPLKTGLDARLEGKAVQRRLQRRRGWSFNLQQDELDYQLGRQLPQALTRPQPTADSDDGGDDEEEGSGGMDEEGGVLVDVPEPPPQGPALDAIKAYAKEVAPEVLWSERVRRAKQQARTTGQVVTVRGRLDRKRRRDLAKRLWKWDNREWFESRKCTPPAPPLHPAVQRVIEQWFHLVDDDGSGTLDHRELMEALRASDVPVSDDNIKEMVQLMDMDEDGVISWKEFETFFMYEFAAGKNLLSGEYVLPSGTALPLGAMIAKLKRARLMSDLMQGGTPRQKWQQVAESPVALEDELGMMAAVELALEEMKNPQLTKQRAEARKALGRLPVHLRTPSFARHLERHPSITKKLLRVKSVATLLTTNMKRMASTTSVALARLASASSMGSVASTAMGSVAGAGGSSFTSASGAGGGGGGRQGPADLNVALAMAAGLEWPVQGSNFYSKQAKSVLRAACQKPPEAILRSRGAVAAGPVQPAANKELSPRIGLSESHSRRPTKQSSSRRLKASRHSHDGRGSDGDGEGDGQGYVGSRRRRQSADSEESVLPWMVNAKRREQEEREELRAATVAAAVAAQEGAGTGEEEGEDGIWVSPLLRRWLQQQRQLRPGEAGEEGRSTDPGMLAVGEGAAAAGAEAGGGAAEAGGDASAPGVLAGQPEASGGRSTAVDLKSLLTGEGSGLVRQVLELAIHVPVSLLREAEDSASRLAIAAAPQQLPAIGSATDIGGDLTDDDGNAVCGAPAVLFGGHRPSLSVRLSLAGGADALARASGGIPHVASDGALSSPRQRKPRRRMRFQDEEEGNADGDQQDTAPGQSGTFAGEDEGPVEPTSQGPLDSGADLSIELSAVLPASSPGAIDSRRSISFMPEPPVAPASPSTQAQQLQVFPLSPGADDAPADAANLASGALLMRASRLSRSACAEPPHSPADVAPGLVTPRVRNSLLTSRAALAAAGDDTAPAAQSQQPPAVAARRMSRATADHSDSDGEMGVKGRQSGSGVSEDGGAGTWPGAAAMQRGNVSQDGTAMGRARAGAGTRGHPLLSDRGQVPMGHVAELDELEVRELMDQLTLQFGKEDGLLEMHSGHAVQRPSTSQFAAALARLRSAAATLVQQHALPPHPAYSGTGSVPDGAGDYLVPQASTVSLPGHQTRSSEQRSGQECSGGGSGGREGHSHSVGAAGMQGVVEHGAGERRRTGSLDGGRTAAGDQGVPLGGRMSAVAADGPAGARASGRPWVTERDSVGGSPGLQGPTQPTKERPKQQQVGSQRASRQVVAPGKSLVLAGMPVHQQHRQLSTEYEPYDHAALEQDQSLLSSYSWGPDGLSGHYAYEQQEQEHQQQQQPAAAMFPDYYPPMSPDPTQAPPRPQPGNFYPAAAAAAAADASPARSRSPSTRIPDSGIVAAAIATSRGGSRCSNRGTKSPSPGIHSPSSRPGSQAASPMPSSTGMGAAPVAASVSLRPYPCPPALPLGAVNSSPDVGGHSATARGGGGGVTARSGGRGPPQHTRRQLHNQLRAKSVLGGAATATAGGVGLTLGHEHWDARVASILQRHTAAELAAVRRRAASLPRASTPDGTVAAADRRTAAEVLPGAERAGQWPGSPLDRRQGYEGGMAAIAGSAVDLLASGGSLPEFIPLAGAMPRLQSRYAPKRPAAVAAALAASPPVISQHEQKAELRPGQSDAANIGPEARVIEGGKESVEEEQQQVQVVQEPGMRMETLAGGRAAPAEGGPGEEWVPGQGSASTASEAQEEEEAVDAGLGAGGPRTAPVEGAAQAKEWEEEDGEEEDAEGEEIVRRGASFAASWRSADGSRPPSAYVYGKQKVVRHPLLPVLSVNHGAQEVAGDAQERAEAGPDEGQQALALAPGQLRAEGPAEEAQAAEEDAEALAKGEDEDGKAAAADRPDDDEQPVAVRDELEGGGGAADDGAGLPSDEGAAEQGSGDGDLEDCGLGNAALEGSQDGEAGTVSNADWDGDGEEEAPAVDGEGAGGEAPGGQQEQPEAGEGAEEVEDGQTAHEAEELQADGESAEDARQTPLAAAAEGTGLPQDGMELDKPTTPALARIDRLIRSARPAPQPVPLQPTPARPVMPAASFLHNGNVGGTDEPAAATATTAAAPAASSAAASRRAMLLRGEGPSQRQQAARPIDAPAASDTGQPHEAPGDSDEGVPYNAEDQHGADLAPPPPEHIAPSQPTGSFLHSPFTGGAMPSGFKLPSPSRLNLHVFAQQQQQQQQPSALPDRSRALHGLSAHALQLLLVGAASEPSVPYLSAEISLSAIASQSTTANGGPAITRHRSRATRSRTLQPLRPSAAAASAAAEAAPFLVAPGDSGADAEAPTPRALPAQLRHPALSAGPHRSEPQPLQGHHAPPGGPKPAARPAWGVPAPATSTAPHLFPPLHINSNSPGLPLRPAYASIDAAGPMSPIDYPVANGPASPVPPTTLPSVSSPRTRKAAAVSQSLPALPARSGVLSGSVPGGSPLAGGSPLGSPVTFESGGAGNGSGGGGGSRRLGAALAAMHQTSLYSPAKRAWGEGQKQQQQQQQQMWESISARGSRTASGAAGGGSPLPVELTPAQPPAPLVSAPVSLGELPDIVTLLTRDQRQQQQQLGPRQSVRVRHIDY